MPPPRKWPPVPEGHRWCTRCEKIQPREEFGRNRAHREGINIYCRSCVRGYARSWTLNNLEECRRKSRERARANPEWALKARLRGDFGLTLQAYKAMEAAQSNVCAICGEPNTRGTKPQRLAVDHCHSTGAVRGLLCDRCNRGIGMFRDRPELLISAAWYLRRSKGRIVGA